MSNINNEKINVNQFSKNRTIFRVSHNRENPFVQLNKNALWDINLSFRAIGMWARCMSRPDDWRFSLKEFVEKCIEGKDAIESTVKELIDAGYAMRFEFTERGDKGQFNDRFVEYVFFEFPLNDEERRVYEEKLKKEYHERDFPVRGNPDRGNPPLLIKNISTNKEIHTEKEYTPLLKPPREEAPIGADAAKAAEKRIKKPPEIFSEEVQQLAKDVIASIVAAKPDFAPPKNLQPLMTHLDFMCRLEGRSASRILDVLRWALADSFWHNHMLKSNVAAYLRKDNRFDSLEAKMMAKPKKEDRKFAPSSDDDAALKKMQAMRARAIY